MKVHDLVVAALAALSTSGAFADAGEDAKIRAEVQSQIDERLAAVLSGRASARDAQDAELRATVLKQINKTPSLKSSDITVQIVNHDVYLRGLTRTDFDRVKAGEIARTIPGVKSVYNEIALDGCGFCEPAKP